MPETDSPPHDGTVIHSEPLAHCAACGDLMARRRLAQDGKHLLCPPCAAQLIASLRELLAHQGRDLAARRDAYRQNLAVVAALTADVAGLEAEVKHLDGHLHPKYDPSESED